MKDVTPVLEASGSPYEIGYALGSQNKNLIPYLVEDNFANLHELFKRKSLTYLPHDKYLALANRYLPYAMEYAPDLVEELRGMAEATEMELSEIFAFNCLMDFEDLAYPMLADQLLFGCTVFGVTGKATTDGQSYIGENYDYRSIFKTAGMVMHLKPDEGPAALLWSMPGLLGCAGVNSAGIGVVINKLVPIDSRSGVPYTFIVRKILQQERIGDAIAAISGARRASGINYLLADATDQVLSLETTATNYEPLYPTKGIIAHTNHYLTPILRGYERFRLPYSHDSLFRYNRMQNLLEDKVGNITMEDLKTFTKDHVNYPFSICRHEGEHVEEPLLTETIASLIIDPSMPSLVVTAGNPCEREYQAFSLGRR
ncbi:MAG: C45 family peptidase [Chloroflexi bacterium]|nr:C45 family peptidase [Chloroflexota bacterium]